MIINSTPTTDSCDYQYLCKRSPTTIPLRVLKVYCRGIIKQHLKQQRVKVMIQNLVVSTFSDQDLLSSVTFYIPVRNRLSDSAHQPIAFVSLSYMTPELPDKGNQSDEKLC